jgi:carboxyl-terminal processing protease
MEKSNLLKNKKKMKTKIFGIMSIFVLVFLAAAYASNQEDKPNPTKDKVILQLILQGVDGGHYQPSEINDDFSINSYKAYLSNIDGAKRFLIQEDVDKLKKYEEQIDDEVKEGTYEFFDLSMEILSKRITEMESYYQEVLAQPFDFTKEESIEFDVEKLDYSQDLAQRKEYWRKYLKYQTMRQLHSNIKKQKKNKEIAQKKDEEFESKSMEDLEKEAREAIAKSQKTYFHRLNRLEKSDWRATYINSVVSIFDPHTSYMAPKVKENFDISFSGRLEGIGATLTEKDDYIEIVRVVQGGAAWKQGELKAGDKILEVAQGDEEKTVDIIGARVSDAVKLIRGKKGSKVRLTIEKEDGTIKEISIIRDLVILEETYAKSAILQREKEDKKIGYIHLPGFYADFTGNGGRHCSTDVEKELEKLANSGAEGVILDLRFNGGGSLQDVVDMVGLFIEKGPVVQVKSKGNDPYILKDKDSKIQFDKPLIVMVNGYSASASEIMAAAIQDYGRGVIVGSPTFGKGTVQRFFDLDKFLRGYEDIKPLGNLKLTVQKFYRINGGATQLKGVVPDVLLPNRYSYAKVGEKEDEYAMNWDEIAALKYKKEELNTKKIKKLKAKSAKRVAANPTFELVKENAKRFDDLSNQTLASLKLEDYIQEQERRAEEAKRFDDIQKNIEGFSALNTVLDKQRAVSDSTFANRMDSWHKTILKDVEIYEATAILEDML